MPTNEGLIKADSFITTFSKSMIDNMPEMIAKGILSAAGGAIFNIVFDVVFQKPDALAEQFALQLEYIKQIVSGAIDDARRAEAGALLKSAIIKY